MPTTRRGHILILVQNLPVPFDRRVWMESTALTEAGYKVSVISPCPPDEADQLHRVIEGVHVYRYPPPPTAENKLAYFREYEYALRHTGKLMKRVWAEDPFDVIHSCNPPDFFWALARRYKKRGVKYVFDHHDLCPELFESKFGRRGLLYSALCWFERRQFNTADGVIATNESYKRVAIERGGKRPEDVAVVRSGPSMDRFRAEPPEPELKRGRKYLGVYLGVMGAQDGVDYALRAVRHLVDRGFTDASFKFMGKGDAFDDLLKLRAELNLEDWVEMPGRVSDLDLRQTLCTADIALAPDPKNPLNDVSTMNKIIEYMAMGVPIVSFDLKESRHSAREAAVYIDNDDERAMADAVAELLGDPDRRRRMGEYGQARVRDELCWDRSRLVLTAFYDRLLGHAAPAEATDAAGAAEAA
ncbi:MAG: glycosyltransferase family 4 protein [Planctomycetota bacterium]